MMRRLRGQPGICNLVLVVLNVITALIGGAIAGIGGWLAHQSPSTCLQYAHFTVLMFGVAVMALSLLAILAAFFRIVIMLRFYQVILGLIILALLGFALFGYFITNKTAARAIAKIGRSLHVADLTEWLRNQLTKASRWVHIKECLRDSKVCLYGISTQSPARMLAQIVEYFASATYKGCCKPPDTCQFSELWGVYINPTNLAASTDCTTYGNSVDTRCFDCETCHEGVLESITSNLKKIIIADLAIAGFLFIIFVLTYLTF